MACDKRSTWYMQIHWNFEKKDKLSNRVKFVHVTRLIHCNSYNIWSMKIFRHYSPIFHYWRLKNHLIHSYLVTFLLNRYFRREIFSKQGYLRYPDSNPPLTLSGKKIKSYAKDIYNLSPVKIHQSPFIGFTMICFLQQRRPAGEGRSSVKIAKI